MARSRFASAHLCAALASSCLVIACGDPGAIDPDVDGGITFPMGDAGHAGVDAGHVGVDGGHVGRDAGPITTGCTSSIECDDGDPSTDDACVGGVCQNTPSGCSADWNCSDFDACTTDACVGGACVFSPITDCAGCHSDAECDDGNPSTMDICDTFTRACSNFPNDPFCSTAADCNDNNPCTGDQCNSGTCAWGSLGTCCFRDTDCGDFDDCTTDTCDVGAHTCGHQAIPGCGTSTCMDFDHDGHGSMFCFPVAGDDCDDTNAAVHPGATENCTNGIDDDCNGFVDGTDPACSSHNTMCGDATTLALPGMAHGTIVSTNTTVTGTDCGTHLYYSFSVTTTSDVTIGLHFDDIAPPTTCPGCPPPTDPMHEIWHNLTVERTCGDATTSVAALSGTGGCYVWGGPFGGSRDHTLQMRRLAPGTYTIDVQAREFFLSGLAEAIPFDLTLSATTSAGAMCDGAALVDGSSTHGTTMGGADAFGLDCSGAPFTSPERVHTFDVTTRSRVRLIGTPTLADGVTYAPGMQLAIRSACDPDIAPTACIDTSGYTCQPSVSLERILDPGSYFVEIQSKNGGATDYDLSFQTEPLGAACAGAAVIAASGSFSGNTTGGTDHFRWNDACGGGAAPETVYELDVASSSRVVLDLIASAHTPVLRVVSGCGDTIVAGSADGTHIDHTLAAGTYQVIVDGGAATDVGSFVLNATLLPM